MPTDWIFGGIGGLIIGLAGMVYLLGAGRIMGASGILGGLIDGSGRETRIDRLLFLSGLVGAPMLVNYLFAAQAGTHASSAPVVLILAGLLVGVGTRLANGCTSGHGVCGISRPSLRGSVATMVYIAMGIASMTMLRLVGGGF